MSLAAHHRRTFAYDAWANRETLASLQAAGDPSAARRAFAHVLAAEVLWLERLQGMPSSLVVWPELDLEACAGLARELPGRWAPFLAEPRLDEPCSYVNSRGERFRTSAGDILTHVAMHSAHHRGQIALLVRQGGGAPASTDFVHCVRQGFLG